MGWKKLCRDVLSSKKRLVFATVITSGIISACNSQTPQESLKDDGVAAKKNVVFILVDDLGYADIEAYNPTSFYETPHINELAKTGIKFTNGYAANPVCSPSRAAIMTGKHPTRMKATEWFHINNYPHREERFRHGLNNDFMANKETTIAEIYKADGYDTAFLGKWHLGDKPDMQPENQGFDINLAGAPFGFPRGGYFSPYNNPTLPDGPEGEYLTDRLGQEAASLIEAYSKTDNPFFLYLSFYTVHVPLEAPEDLIGKYQTKAAAQADGPDFEPEDQYHISTDAPRENRIRQNHPIYASMIEKMDDNVGRVLQALEDTGQADNTIVVFTSDNGGLSSSEGSPTSNLPLRGAKGWLYEGGIRVPYIIKLPDQQGTNRIIDRPVVAMDFLPTLTSLTQTALPNIKGMDGKDLNLQNKGQRLAEDRSIFWHYPHYSNQGGFPGAAVRRGKYKLLQNFEDGSLQLYDLEADISEQIDIKSDYPDVLTELKQALYEWYDSVDAEFLRPIEKTPNIRPWQPESVNP